MAIGDRQSAIKRSGMSLVESVVAMGVLSLLLVLVGAVFSHASNAMQAVRARLASNQSAQAAGSLMRMDLRSGGPGVLVLIQGGSEDGVAGADMLLTTATGRFVSRFEVDAATGRPVKANAALIVYMLVDRVDSPAGAVGRVLCRYVYLLTGRGGSPRDIFDIVDTADGGDINPFDNTDVLGDSLADVVSKQWAGSAGLRKRYVEPLAGGPYKVNTQPTSLDDRISGGVVQLWPYLTDGMVDLQFAYSMPSASGGVMQWLDLADPLPTVLTDAKVVKFIEGKRFFAWHRQGGSVRPSMIRAILTLPGVSRESQFVLPVVR